MRSDTTPVIQGVRLLSSRAATTSDIRDALTLAYPGAVFVGWSAAALHGAQFTEGRPPEIWLPQQRARRGIVVRRGSLPDADVVVALGRRATSGVRTAVDLARWVAGDEAVAALDQCLRVDHYGQSVTTPSAVRSYLAQHPGLYGRSRAMSVLGEAGIGADSPWETYTRLVLARAGFTGFTAQQPIPGTRYRADLAATRYRIAIEYDGEYHRTAEQHRRDIARWNAITGQGWAVIRVTATMLVHARGEFTARVFAELVGRGYPGPPPRPTQLTLPAPAIRSGFRAVYSR